MSEFYVDLTRDPVLIGTRSTADMTLRSGFRPVVMFEPKGQEVRCVVPDEKRSSAHAEHSPVLHLHSPDIRYFSVKDQTCADVGRRVVAALALALRKAVPAGRDDAVHVVLPASVSWDIADALQQHMARPNGIPYVFHHQLECLVRYAWTASPSAREIRAWLAELRGLWLYVFAWFGDAVCVGKVRATVTKGKILNRLIKTVNLRASDLVSDGGLSLQREMEKQIVASGERVAFCLFDGDSEEGHRILASRILNLSQPAAGRRLRPVEVGTKHPALAGVADGRGEGVVFAVEQTLGVRVGHGPVHELAQAPPEYPETYRRAFRVRADDKVFSLGLYTTAPDVSEGENLLASMQISLGSMSTREIKELIFVFELQLTSSREGTLLAYSHGRHSEPLGAVTFRADVDMFVKKGTRLPCHPS